MEPLPEPGPEPPSPPVVAARCFHNTDVTMRREATKVRALLQKHGLESKRVALTTASRFTLDASARAADLLWIYVTSHGSTDALPVFEAADGSDVLPSTVASHILRRPQSSRTVVVLDFCGAGSFASACLRILSAHREAGEKIGHVLFLNSCNGQTLSYVHVLEAVLETMFDSDREAFTNTTIADFSGRFVECLRRTALESACRKRLSLHTAVGDWTNTYSLHWKPKPVSQEEGQELIRKREDLVDLEESIANLHRVATSETGELVHTLVHDHVQRDYLPPAPAHHGAAAGSAAPPDAEAEA